MQNAYSLDLFSACANLWKGDTRRDGSDAAKAVLRRCTGQCDHGYGLLPLKYGWYCWKALLERVICVCEASTVVCVRQQCKCNIIDLWPGRRSLPAPQHLSFAGRYVANHLKQFSNSYLSSLRRYDKLFKFHARSDFRFVSS